MPTLIELWIPILVSAAAVFVLSSILHMCVPIHKHDQKKLPNEDEVLDAMRKQGVVEGSYRFPMMFNMKDMHSPEMMAKLDAGPSGYMVVFPKGPWKMGKSLLHWFLYSILIGVVVAYLCTIGLPKGSADVFRFTATAAFLAYGIAAMHDSIWKGIAWGVTAKFIFDGLLYALATGAVFAWLYPQVAA